MLRTMVEDSKRVLWAISKVRYTSMILTLLILLFIGSCPVLYMVSGGPSTTSISILLALILFGSAVLGLTISLTYIIAVSLFGRQMGLSFSQEPVVGFIGRMRSSLHVLILKTGISLTGLYMSSAAV